jgi:hypothetical protein
MQTPTPPTKPTPPMPPTMNIKPAAHSNTEPPASSPTPPAVSTAKPQNTASPKEAATASPPQPSGTYQETSSQNLAAPAVLTANKQQSSLGFGFLFALVLLLGIAGVCFRLWRNRPNSQRKSRTILDYSTDTSKDLLELINSPISTMPSSSTIVKGKSSTTIKSNFEVRI